MSNPKLFITINQDNGDVDSIKLSQSDVSQEAQDIYQYLMMTKSNKARHNTAMIKFNDEGKIKMIEEKDYTYYTYEILV